MALATMFIATLAMGQQVKINKTFVVADRSTAVGEEVRANDFIFIISDSLLYRAKSNFSRTLTGTYLLASPTRYQTVGSGTAAISGASFSDDVVMDSTLIVKGYIQSGYAGRDGQFKIFSEQGGTDYTITINPNSAMTSNAAFYLPADEPGSTLPVTMTSGGVMGYNDQALTTTSAVGFGTVTATTSVAVGSQVITQANTNKASFNNSVAIADTMFSYGNYVLGNSYNSGTSAVLGIQYFDSSIYYGCDYSNNWMLLFVPEVGIPRYRMDLQNLADVSIQNKAGTGQVEILERDTTESTAKANLTNLKDVTGSGTLTMGKVTILSDTVVTDALWTIAKANGHVYVKIAETGATSDRWKQIDN